MEKDLDILHLIKQQYRPYIIKNKLGLTTYRYKKILKYLKENGYTQVKGYGGSGCTCSLSENQSYCDCDGSPFVGRFTDITDKGLKYLKTNQK